MQFAFVICLVSFVLPTCILTCKTVEELDECAHQMNFLGNRNLKIPKNDDEVLDMCARAKRSLKCLNEEGAKCLTGPIKTITTKIFNDWEKHFSTRCDSPTHRSDYLKHVQCFTNRVNAGAIRLCSDKHILMMERVANLPRELVRGGSCCSSIEMRECILGEIRTQCRGETGEYFHEVIHEMVEENHELACPEYPNMDSCNAKYNSTVWSELKSIYHSNDVSAILRHKYKTVVPIFFKIISATGEL